MTIKATLVHLYQILLCRPSLTPVFLKCYKLSLRGLGVLNSGDTASTGERWLFSTAKRLPIKTVVDVGANTGSLTLELLRFFPDAHFYCLEPNPETFLKLTKNLKQYKHTHVYNLAASEKNAQTTLYDFADSAPLKPTQPTATMATLHKAVIEEFHKQPAKAYKVETTSLDAFTKKAHIKKVDWLKIDTEGHELSVLKGCTHLIKSNNLGVVHFEFNEMNVFSHTFLRDIIVRLPNHAFYRLLPRGVIPLHTYRPLTHEIFGFQNIVALNKNFNDILRFKSIYSG